MAVKLNFSLTTKNHSADSKKGSQEKNDFRAVGPHESHPTAWELTLSIIVDLSFCKYNEKEEDNDIEKYHFSHSQFLKMTSNKARG